MDIIRSPANPALKRVRAAAAGREKGIVLLEGGRLVSEARRQGCEFDLLLVSDDHEAEAAELAETGALVRVVRDDLMQQVSRLERSPGVIALVHAPRARNLADLDVRPETLVAVAAGVQDPGNLGAVARAAEAAGAQALVVLAGGCSPWSEKAMRGSMGSLLRLPVYLVEDAAAAVATFQHLGVRQVRAVTRGGVDWRRFDWGGPLAAWFGSEAGLLPSATAAFEAVSIPMAVGVESLNVACAAALLLFSAGRTDATAD
jgi:TrmH family RNA methyltransferase